MRPKVTYKEIPKSNEVSCRSELKGQVCTNPKGRESINQRGILKEDMCDPSYNILLLLMRWMCVIPTGTK